MNKPLNLIDHSRQTDIHDIKKTRVVIQNHVTKETLFDGENKVIIAGSAFTAAKQWNITPKIWTPSYNEVLKLDNTINDPFTEPGLRREEKICLFAVGVGGCGVLNSQIYDVDITKWISEVDLVPFRYQLLSDDLQGYMRTKYFGRKTLTNRIAYYFKAFEIEPEFKQQFIDGTPIDENIYKSTRLDKVESFVRVQLAVTKDDCRDYFKSTIGISEAQINSISLIEGWKVTIDGYDYYQDLRPVTRCNFQNEQLIDLSKGLDITYDTFY